MPYFERMDVSEETSVMHEKSEIFFTIGIFLIRGLSFNFLSAMGIMIY